jgi:hypothetical protein
VEEDAFAQGEGVGQAVLGDLPRLGQRRLDGEVGADPGQAVVDVLDDVPDGGQALLLGIERGRVGLEPDLEDAAGDGDRRGSCAAASRRSPAKGAAKPRPAAPATI